MEIFAGKIEGNNNASPKDGHVQWRGSRSSNGQCNGLSGCGLDGGAGDSEGGGPAAGSEGSAAAGQDKLERPSSTENDTIHLQRRVGLFSGVALIVGTMIGSGIFVSPSGLLERTGSIGMSFVIWMACGLLSLLGKLTTDV
nr:large neutral amino acids transporter small subunit 1-like isoform X2 [Leptinotarsa decemlineata]